MFSRDLYEAFTGLLTDGDLATARDTVTFLFNRQQLSDGRFPRNSLVNGRTAPDTGGDQLDESSYPILMAWQAGLAGDNGLWPKIKAAADFVVSHGPSFGNERWEEQSGYLALDHRGRDRRAGRRRVDRRPAWRRTPPRASTGRRPTTSSARSRAGR